MKTEVVRVSYGTLLLVVAMSCLSVGLALSLVTGRRGHDAFAWLLPGTLFGPLAAIFAVEARRDERVASELVTARQWSGRGTVDVLVGVDGFPASRAALAAGRELLGSRMGRRTLATVIPFDSGVATQRTARAVLEQEGEAVDGEAELELPDGRPAPAPVLLQRLAEGAYNLLVRSHSLQKLMLSLSLCRTLSFAKLSVAVEHGHPSGRPAASIRSNNSRPCGVSGALR